MTAATQTSTENLLLAALPREEYERLTPHLREVSLKLNQVLFNPGDEIAYAYFPTDSIVSLLTDLSDGSGMEVGLVGREGLAGISVILGGSETKVATVQAVGHAFKIRADVLREDFRRGGALQTGLLRYTHALMTQISQSVVCNARHPLPGRLARWLLMYHDRLGRDEFELTHEFMAAMLGVRRASVSEVAIELQRMGFISYRRGRVRIIDRVGMEKFTCECYPVVKEKYEDLLL
ncbi:MAG TPA: Crp/Fnr family transcriptional regulator [Pyrinomonadaceae bacterium]|nr:Crp/Fnr family transcriptional regulator [Pyrinomonadaceae bacterium]